MYYQAGCSLPSCNDDAVIYCKRRHYACGSHAPRDGDKCAMCLREEE